MNNEAYTRLLDIADEMHIIPLQDYMLRYALSLANEDGLVVQIHTGLQEGLLPIHDELDIAT